MALCLISQAQGPFTFTFYILSIIGPDVWREAYMYVPSSMLALHEAVCDRWSRKCDHQGRNPPTPKNSELFRFPN
jgi:hypothetical protein